jgi:MFS family permease
MVDIWAPAARGHAVSFFVVCVFIGPVLGPVVGPLYVHPFVEIYYIEIRQQRSRKPFRGAMDILDHDDYLSRLWDSDNILYAGDIFARPSAVEGELSVAAYLILCQHIIAGWTTSEG